MKRWLMVVGVFSLLSVGLTQSGGDAWKREAVTDLGDAGLNVSFPDGSFLGENSLTGYQAAVMIDQLLGRVDERTGCTDPMVGLPDPSFSFTDVPKDHWAYAAAQRLAELGVRDAFPDGAFHGDAFLSGYQTAILVSKAVDVIDAKTTCGEQAFETRLGEMAAELDGLRGAIASGTLQGPAGPVGPQGLMGPAGADGANGSEGERGIPGLVGAVGPAGPTGPRGPTGPAGLMGPAGPVGEDGADGLACWDLNGNGRADITEDVNLDGKIDALDCQGLAGPAGPDGPAGPKGDRGPTGSAGFMGPAGPAGSAGEDGIDGLACWDLNGNGRGDIDEDINLDGKVDALDCQGLAGPAGPQGPEGPKGERGSGGPRGAAGADGPRGPAGSKGDKGERGPQGPQGPQGPPGR